jgi:flagellar hook-length control protein FliK
MITNVPAAAPESKEDMAVHQQGRKGSDFEQVLATVLHSGKSVHRLRLREAQQQETGQIEASSGLLPPSFTLGALLGEGPTVKDGKADGEGTRPLERIEPRHEDVSIPLSEPDESEEAEEMMPTDELLTPLIGSSAGLVSAPELEAADRGADQVQTVPGTAADALETSLGLDSAKPMVVETALDDQLQERTAIRSDDPPVGWRRSLGLLQEIAGSGHRLGESESTEAAQEEPPWVTGVDKTMLEVRVDDRMGSGDSDVALDNGEESSLWSTRSLTEQQSVDVKISTRAALASQESVELPTETPVQLLEPQGVDENGRAGMGIGDSGDQDRTEYFEVPVLVRPSEDALTRFPQESRTRASEATATLGEMTQTTDSGPSIAKPDVAQDGDYGRDLQMSSQKGSVEEQVLRGDGQDAAPQRVRDGSEKDEAPPASKSATNERRPHSQDSQVLERIDMVSDPAVEDRVSSSDGRQVPARPVLDLRDPEQVLPKLVKTMESLITDERSEVRIELKPEHLGELKIRISMERGIMTAEFLVESRRVQEMISAQLPGLYAALQEQGTALSDVSIDIGFGGEQADSQNSSQRRSTGRRGQDSPQTRDVASPRGYLGANAWNRVDVRV